VAELHPPNGPKGPLRGPLCGLNCRHLTEQKRSSKQGEEKRREEKRREDKSRTRTRRTRRREQEQKGAPPKGGAAGVGREIGQGR